MTLQARINLRPITRRFHARIRKGWKAGGVGREVVKVLHRDVDRQFLAEEYRYGRSRESWVPSQRVLRNLGGSPRTLEDEGNYRAAWTGKGAGMRTAVRRDAVAVGVDTTRFPHVRVFQGQVQHPHVVARRIGVSFGAARQAAVLLSRAIAQGQVSTVQGP